MTPDLLALLQGGGPLGIAIAVLVMLIRGDLVPKWAHLDVCEERDRWREIALRGTELAKDAVSLGERR